MDKPSHDRYDVLFVRFSMLIGLPICALSIFFSWYRRYVYEYSDTVSSVLNTFLNRAALCFLLLTAVYVVLILNCIQLRRFKEIPRLALLLCIFAASIYANRWLSEKDNMLCTLINPTVVAKSSGGDAIMVQPSHEDTIVFIVVTQSEYALFQEQTQYASIVYSGNERGGILRRVSQYPE